MSADAVLADLAMTRGVAGPPHCLALWASAEPGVLGQLGAEALLLCAVPLAWSWRHVTERSTCSSRQHTASRIRSASVIDTESLTSSRRLSYSHSKTRARRAWGTGSWSVSRTRSGARIAWQSISRTRSTQLCLQSPSWPTLHSS